MGIRLEDLGPAARAQAERQIADEKARRKALNLGPAPDAPESRLEADFYTREIWPLILSGEIVECEMHKTFLLLPAAEYCGIRLHKAEYTPDFWIRRKNGTIEVIEVKSKAVRRLQQSYVYRRRLFIDLYARPNGWIFREVIE